jgi:hypothetical protein
MDIREGDFVYLQMFGDGAWIEVKQTLPAHEPMFRAIYWQDLSDRWGTIHYQPNDAHKDMTKEVLRLDPAVADIFRETVVKQRKER